MGFEWYLLDSGDTGIGLVGCMYYLNCTELAALECEGEVERIFRLLSL